MKEVFRSADTALIGLFQSILDDAGIPYFVRNSATHQALMPLPDCCPVLCVLRDEDHPGAMDLLRSTRQAAPPVSDEWKCAACGETTPGNFTSCWNCETARRLG